MNKDNNLWFFAHNTDNHDKVDEIEQNPAVQISVVSRSEQFYYSINGKSNVITNQGAIDK